MSRRSLPRPNRRRSGRRAAVALATIVAALPASAGGGGELPEPLRAFEASYSVTRSGMQLGTTELTLARHAGGWRFRSVTEAQGVFSLLMSGPSTEETILAVHKGALRPLRYRHTEPDEADNFSVVFDWAADEARVERAAGDDVLALAPGTHDPFSALLAVIQRVAGGAETVRLPGIDDDGEPQTLRFAVRARERIEVPLGTYEAVRVHRVRDDKRTTVTWLAPKLDWLPVRMVQRKKGDLVARAELTTLDGQSARDQRSRRTERPGHPGRPGR